MPPFRGVRPSRPVSLLRDRPEAVDWGMVVAESALALEPVDQAQEVEIALEIDRPLRPGAGGGSGTSPDGRVLGVAVREIWLE